MRRIRMLTAGAVAVTMSLATACSAELKLDGRDVAGDAPFLQQIEEKWRNAIGKSEVAVADGSHCWLARTKESKEFDRQAFCGPVRHLGAGDDGVWDVWSFDADVAEDGTVTMTDAAPKAVGADFPAEREAFRPDGAKIPADASALAAPKPPPVPKGFLDQVEGVQIRDPKKPSAATGRLVTPEVELTVAAAGGVDTLPGDGRVALRGPAEGEQLRALSFVLTARDVKRDLSRNVAPTYAVQVGSVRKPIVIPIEAGPDEEPARVTLVAGVPKGQDAQLVMTVAGVEQTMSITTGERTSKTVPAYYRSSTEVVLNKQYGPARVTIGRFGIEHKVRFTRVEVLPYVWYAGWAKPGTVWLQFHYEDFNLRKTTTIDYYEDPVFSGEKSLSLTDDQGRKYPYNAKGLPVLEEYGGGASFAMAVSDTAKSVTLTYAPTGTFEPDPSWVHQAKPQRGAIAFKPLTVPIALPQ
jgi:hypothetical protein